MSPDPGRWTQFERACAHAVGGGITAAALIDRDANVVALAGTLADTDVRAIVGVVSESLKGDELARVLFSGASFEFALDQHTVSVASQRDVCLSPSLSPTHRWRVTFALRLSTWRPNE